jgi:predicted membrane metal-binding protein
MAVLVRPVGYGEAPPGLLRQSWEVTWATCPIGLVHFGEAAAWGVLSNLIAVPVFTLWVLPLGALGLRAVAVARAGRVDAGGVGRAGDPRSGGDRRVGAERCPRGGWRWRRG